METLRAASTEVKPALHPVISEQHGERFLGNGEAND